MYKVFLADHIAPEARRRLEERVELVDRFDRPEELDAIIVRQTALPGDVIRRAVKCRVIQMHGIGLERIDTCAAAEMGIPVLITRGGNNESVAELVVALVLALARKLKYVDQGMREGRFARHGTPELLGTEIYGKRFGLVGSGQIGQLTASIMAAAFHTEIWCFNPSLTEEKARALGYRRAADLRELMAKCDIVSVQVPLTDATRHMFNADVFAAANPDLLFVNTSRGGVVDESALYTALTTGQIRAAAMDVFEREPPPAEHPLLALENFVGTMHVGGNTPEALKRNGQIVAENIFRALGIED